MPGIQDVGPFIRERRILRGKIEVGYFGIYLKLDWRGHHRSPMTRSIEQWQGIDKVWQFRHKPVQDFFKTLQLNYLSQVAETTRNVCRRSQTGNITTLKCLQMCRTIAIMPRVQYGLELNFRGEQFQINSKVSWKHSFDCHGGENPIQYLPPHKFTSMLKIIATLAQEIRGG